MAQSQSSDATTQPKRSKTKSLLQTIGTGVIAPAVMKLAYGTSGTPIAAMPTESQVVGLVGIAFGGLLYYGADEVNVRRLPEGTVGLVNETAETVGDQLADNTEFVTPDGTTTTKADTDE